MNKIYIYYHNDHDGIVAAGILYNFLLDREVYRDEDIIFNMIDYDKELNFDKIDFIKKDQVYFLDYSFSSEHNQHEFEKLLNRRQAVDDVVWIDHHLSSIGLFENYHIHGIRNTSLCGAMWTYLYTKDTVTQILSSSKTLDLTISELVYNDHSIPMFLKYIDDYDCWKKLMVNTNDFHYGLVISNPKDTIISNLLNTNKEEEYINDIIFKGREIQKYLNFENKEYHVDMYGFEFTLPKEHGGLRCFCLNRKGNSIMFGDKIKEYDAVIPFYYIDGKWKYSIFTDKDHINCAEIAKTYGGGGHKRAAGWVGDFIFTDSSSFGDALLKDLENEIDIEIVKQIAKEQQRLTETS